MEAAWHSVLPGFLLLPGDGLLLVDGDLRLVWLDRDSRQRFGPENGELNGVELGRLWPELALVLDPLRPALERGPIDRTVAWPASMQRDGIGPQPVRLFRTDTGFGIGLLRAVAPSDAVTPWIAMLCRLLDAVNEALLVTLCEPLDLPGPIIIFANRRLAAYNGYSRDEILGRSPRIFQGPDTDPQQLRRFRQGLQRWQPDLSIEILNYGKDGRPHWAEISAAPMADEQGDYQCWIAVQRNITHRKILESKLADQAATDPLTGALNRRGLEEKLERILRSDPERLGIIYADVDDLKRFNDSYGHAEGDRLLLEVIRRIRSVLRDDDLLARVGGDEFVVVLPKLHGQEDARRLAARIQTAMDAPWMELQPPVALSISIGIALPDAPLTSLQEAQALLQQADRAMYEAKAAGRQAIHVAEAPPPPSTHR
jgi:diguanylate cyclase (GGDEF)-like protein/PAS domain S-box-containing protein